jgi:hypothetical protein
MDSIEAEASKPTATALRNAADLGQRIKDEGREAAEQVRGQVEEAGDRVKQGGKEFLARQKSRVSAELHTFSEAARRASQRLEEENDHHVARYVSRAADCIDRAGQRLDQREISALMGDVENAVRRHPEVVFGSLFIAGVTMARFLKASGRARDSGPLSRPAQPEPALESIPPGRPRGPLPSPAPATPWTAQAGKSEAGPTPPPGAGASGPTASTPAPRQEWTSEAGQEIEAGGGPVGVAPTPGGMSGEDEYLDKPN